jgi:hypothetical protein
MRTKTGGKKKEPNGFSYENLDLILRVWGQGLGFGREEGNLGLGFRAAPLPERPVMHKARGFMALHCYLVPCVALTFLCCYHLVLLALALYYYCRLTLLNVVLNCSMSSCIAALALCCSLPP